MQNKTNRAMKAYKNYNKFEKQFHSCRANSQEWTCSGEDCEDKQNECARSMMGSRLWFGCLYCETRKYVDVLGNRINFRTEIRRFPDVEKCDKLYNADTIEKLLSTF